MQKQHTIPKQKLSFLKEYIYNCYFIFISYNLFLNSIQLGFSSIAQLQLHFTMYVITAKLINPLITYLALIFLVTFDSYFFPSQNILHTLKSVSQFLPVLLLNCFLFLSQNSRNIPGLILNSVFFFCTYTPSAQLFSLFSYFLDLQVICDPVIPIFISNIGVWVPTMKFLSKPTNLSKFSLLCIICTTF